MIYVLSRNKKISLNWFNVDHCPYGSLSQMICSTYTCVANVSLFFKPEIELNGLLVKLFLSRRVGT